MSMRFLHIKRAHVADTSLNYEVERDILSNTQLLQKVYGESTHDMCAITEDGEWLMHGRKMNPTVLLHLYTAVFIYIHSPHSTYDAAMLFCKAHAQKSVSVYNAIDVLTHHTERLASLIRTHALSVKVPHEVYLDMKMYNDDFVPAETIASAHIRKVFLPVHILPSSHKSHVSDIHTYRLAHTHAELSEHIDSLRHHHTHLTLREKIQGQSVYVVSIPHFREERVYITMPLEMRSVESFIHTQHIQLTKQEKDEVVDVVRNLSQVVFHREAAVYKLNVHSKRGVFIENTFPAYMFMMHNPDFLFALADTHGVSVQDLIQHMIL